MANSSSPDLVANFFVAGLSLIVTVASGILVFRYTDKQADLSYDVVTSAVFEGQTTNISIVNVKVNNPAQKEVEDVWVTIPVEDSKITEYKVTGLQKEQYSKSSDIEKIQINIPYLNPQDSFSVQLLLSPLSESFYFDSSKVIVRGKGVTAVAEVDNQDEGFYIYFVVVSMLVFVLISTIIGIVTYLYPAVFYTKKHRDDQRDVIAYVLGVHGFYQESSQFRSLERDTSYWALSDYIAEKCIDSGQEDKTKSAIESLQNLLEYADIETTSKMLIEYNISRLYAAIGDVNSAKKYLKLARKGRHRVIEMRVSFDKNLSQLV